MKRIGLIGGLSPESTVHYYLHICRAYNREFGQLNFPEITLESVNLQHLVTLFDLGDWDGVAGILLEALHRLKAAGADFAAILANTPHNSCNRLQGRLPLEILTIMDATAAVIQRDHRRRVALLGTKATMEYGFFQFHFGALGIETCVPGASERTQLDRIIWEELSHGIVSPAAGEAACTMLAGLQAQGAEAVILGCTELGLLIAPDDTPLPLYDTLRIHAEAILDFALDRR